MTLLVHKLFFEEKFSISMKLINLFYDIEEYFSIVFTIFLIFKTYKLIGKNEIKNKSYRTNQSNIINTVWLKKLLYFGLLICILWFLTIFMSEYMKSNLFDNIERYFLWISISILIYCLGYLGVYQSIILSQREQIRNLQNFTKTGKRTYSNNQKFEHIDATIKNRRLYINPNLSLDVLAEEFNLSNGYISQLFNKFGDTNFSSYINELRVEEAKKMLVDKDYSAYTIVAIALESGFNSKSAFYNAFKRITKISPIEFRKRYMS